MNEREVGPCEGNGCGGMKGCTNREFDREDENCIKCEKDAYEAMTDDNCGIKYHVITREQIITIADEYLFAEFQDRLFIEEFKKLRKLIMPKLEKRVSQIIDIYKSAIIESRNPKAEAVSYLYAYINGIADAVIIKTGTTEMIFELKGEN